MDTNEQMVERVTAAIHERLEKTGREAIAFGGSIEPGADAPLNRYFDHTLLKPDATRVQYETLCREAAEARTQSVCVPPDRVALAVDVLGQRGAMSGSDPVVVCTVIGFPFGYAGSLSKAAEVETTRDLGASEFDVVLPVGRLRDGDFERVYDDLRSVTAEAGAHAVKVILETALLNDEEKVAAGVIAVRAGVAYLKTSTGFANGGATIEDLRLLRLVAGPTHGVKASGGVRTLEFTRQCIAAGANRIGASASVAILAEAAGSAPATRGESVGY